MPAEAGSKWNRFHSRSGPKHMGGEVQQSTAHAQGRLIYSPPMRRRLDRLFTFARAAENSPLENFTSTSPDCQKLSSASS